MKVAITGATGFLGSYIVVRLMRAGHRCRCWYRRASDRSGLESVAPEIEWVEGELGNAQASRSLLAGCEAIVHAALDFPRGRARASQAFTIDDARRNSQATFELIEAARREGVGRFVFISSCAVYGQVLADRPLDETHPLWPADHYGAHKAAIEAFVHSYGSSDTYSICALRPTGIYGLAYPIEHSKWYELIRSVVRGEEVECRRGGKEVHAADVASAVETLLNAENLAGETFNCYDRYISEYDVATLAKELTGSTATIHGAASQPKNQIVTDKIRALGVRFGGDELLRDTVGQMIRAIATERIVSA
jgi:nucleoside-diphosphate-sugar epimerase